MLKVQALVSLFAKVELVALEAEVRQDRLIGDDPGDLKPQGHVYIGLIPTSRDTDGWTGTDADKVNAVPNKQTIPLSSVEQANRTFHFRLEGFELDLAQDPRRGAGVVCWVGNSGVQMLPFSDKKITSSPVCSVTWRLVLQCSGETALWI